MKAIILKEQGGIENLQLAEIPVPAIGPDEVLVEVKAISINPADALIRQHKAIDWVFGGETPKILGWDISGVVTAVGNNVAQFKKGDAVFGAVKHAAHGKAYAEYVAAPANHLALKPANVSHEAAAATGLAALTVLQPMQKEGIHAGQKVFITAAGGGVGHFAVQLAKYFGAYVIALASGSKKDFVLSLGADAFIDYQTQRFEDIVNDADLAIEAVRTEDHLLRTLKTLKPGGTLISLWSQVTPAEAARAQELGVHAYYNAVESNGKDMEFIAQLLESGALRPHISRVFSLEEIPLAHAAIEQNNTQGKIVISLH